jgi:hypothetical protein
VVALVAFTVLGKPLIVAALAVRSGESRQVALSAGISLGQTSEFAFILAGLAVASGLASESALAVVGMVGLLTMGVSAILIPPGHRLLAGSSVPGVLKRFVPTRFDLLGEAGASPQGPPSRSGHVVVVGMNSLGRRIVEFLIDRGERVLAVDTDLEKLRDLPCPVLLGNAEYLAVLDDAGLPNARMLVSALHIEEVNRLLAYRASRLEIPSVIHAHDQAAEQELQRLGVAHVLDSRQAGVARTIEVLSELGIFGR